MKILSQDIFTSLSKRVGSCGNSGHSFAGLGLLVRPVSDVTFPIPRKELEIIVI